MKPRPEEMTNAQLKAVIAFKNRKLDRAVPTTKKPLLERYYKTYQRFNMTLQEALTEAGMVEVKALVDVDVDLDLDENDTTDDPPEML